MEDYNNRNKNTQCLDTRAERRGQKKESVNCKREHRNDPIWTTEAK